MKTFLPLSLLAWATAFAAPNAGLAQSYGRPIAVDPITTQGAGPNLGGGFIELLMTGRDPGRARQPAAFPRSAPRNLPALPETDDDDFDPRSGRLRQVSLPEQRPLDLPVERSFPARFEPQEVDYSGGQPPGTIIIDTPSKFLFLVQPGGKARRYGIGVGRPGFEWAGVKTITRKQEWPDWRPPAQMLLRRPDLPRFMAGGPENPMGARGLYLGSTLYRIHGTNEPHTIGQAVSSGCIRMRNEDVIDLYDRVRLGTRVVVI